MGSHGDDRSQQLFEWRDAIVDSPSPSDGGLTSTQRLVALVLAKFVNRETLTTFVGPTRISNSAAVHLVTVKRTLRELAGAGWLIVESHGSSAKGGQRMANVYRLSFPQPVAQDTGSTAHPVHGARRPGPQNSPTGSRVLPQPVSNSYRDPRKKLSTAEFVTARGGCQHEQTFRDRVEEYFEDPTDRLEAIEIWRERVTAGASA